MIPQKKKLFNSNFYVVHPGVAGGLPVRLLKSDTDFGYSGSWSPDGNWFVYWGTKEGQFALNKVKTTGQAEPETLKANVNLVSDWVPVWSPAGDWILYPDGGVKFSRRQDHPRSRREERGGLCLLDRR